MRRAIYAIASGTVAGFIFDQYYESRSPYVNRGHRERNGGSSVYDVMAMTGIFPPLGIPVFVGFVWMSPGIFLSNKYDRLMYPERWDPAYKSPAVIWNEYKSRFRGGGPPTGIPQFGEFF